MSKETPSPEKTRTQSSTVPKPTRPTDERPRMSKNHCFLPGPNLWVSFFKASFAGVQRETPGVLHQTLELPDETSAQAPARGWAPRALAAPARCRPGASMRSTRGDPSRRSRRSSRLVLRKRFTPGRWEMECPFGSFFLSRANQGTLKSRAVVEMESTSIQQKGLPKRHTFHKKREIPVYHRCGGINPLIPQPALAPRFDMPCDFGGTWDSGTTV